MEEMVNVILRILPTELTPRQLWVVTAVMSPALGLSTDTVGAVGG